MAQPYVADLLKLDVEERLEVVRILWNSILDTNHEIPLTAEERKELDSRLSEHERDPDGGYDWEVVKASLRRR